MNKDQFVKKSNIVHSNFYDYSLVEYKNNKTPITIICPNHGQFKQRPDVHLRGSNCKKCTITRLANKTRKSTPQFIEEANAIHESIYNYSLIDYKNNTTNVIILCDKHGKFYQTPKNHLNGHGCPSCASYNRSIRQSKNNSEVISEFKKIHGSDKYDYSLVDYKNNKKKVTILCQKHGAFEVSPSHHLNGIGCNKCSNCYHRDVLELIDVFSNTHGDKYTYCIGEYNNTKEKIKIKCPIHGTYKQIIQHHSNGHGCPSCNQSKGEEQIEKILKEHGIKYIREKTFEDCLSKKQNKLRFDFYLPNLNILIEYDGIQHFKTVEYFGGISYLNEVKHNDEIKNNYCINNKIKLYRISYNQNIKNKMNKIMEN